MNSSAPEKTDESPRLAARLRRSYQRARPWVVGTFVLIGLASPLFPAEYRYVPLTALLGVVAQALLEVLGRLDESTAEARVRVVSDVIEGLPEMGRCLDECRSQHLPIRIQWIGMTMYNAWNSLERVLDRLSRENVSGVAVEIAMLSADWLRENPINPEWDADQAMAMGARIETYFRSPKPRQLQWSLTIHRYSHMPILHGGLFSNRTLFLGISRWDDGILRAGQKSYEVYRTDDGAYARDRVDLFAEWFRFCSGERETWYDRNRLARQARGHVASDGTG